MVELTPEKRRKLEAAAELVEHGDLAVLKKILEFGDYLDENNVKLSEFFSNIEEEVKKYQSMISEELATISPTISEQLKAIEPLIEECKSQIESVRKEVASVDKDNKDSVKVLQQELASKIISLSSEIGKVMGVLNALPPEVDLTDIYTKLVDLEKKIPEIPKVTPIEVRDKLETLEGNDRLDKSAIKGIEELEQGIKEAKTRTVGGTRGVQLYVDSAKKGLANTVNLKAGSNITLTHATANGQNDITIASTGGGASLTVAEIDGNPSVSNVTAIKFTNGSVTNNGDGTVNVATGAGGGGDVSKVGTPVNNQVGVWTGDGTIEGTDGLVYDNTYNQLEIGGPSIFTDTDHVPLSVTQTLDDFIGISLQNLSGGTNAVGDIFISADNDGTGQQGHYVDMGQLGSGFSAAVLGQVKSLTVNAGGTGYVIGDILTLSSGDANAMVEVTAVSGGAVTDVLIVDNGTGYSVASTNTTGGTGTGCTLNVVTLIDRSLFTANDGYLYESGGNLLLGTDDSVAGKVVKIFTGGTSTAHNRVTISDTSMAPGTNDALTLGSTTKQFSDLFLAEGGVINFDNGDLTLTQSGNSITVGGGDLALGANNLTMTGSVGATGARATKVWTAALESTAMPTVNGTSLSSTFAPIASPTFTGTVTLPVGLTGVVRADTGVVSVDTDVTDLVTAASATAQGKVELATDAETVTGTDTARATTPANITAKMAAPGTIGGTTPGAATFTTVTVNDDAYDATTWNGNSNVPTKNAVRDKIEALVAGGGYTNLTQFVDQTAWRVFYSNTSGDVTELALGADGTFLKSNGASAAPSFATPAGSGDVIKVGTPVNNQVGVWTGDGTIEGDSALVFDTTSNTLTISTGVLEVDTITLAGTGTLNGLDAIDATTEATIEAAIDTLPNLTSVQGLTVTLADAGADALLGWDDSAAAYENMTQAEVLAIIGDSTATAKGVVELATDAETVTGTDTVRATTPANIVAKLAAPGAIGATTPSTGKFTSVETTGAIELGAASDTTVARLSAGQISVEGVQVVTTANSVTLSSKAISGSLQLTEGAYIALDAQGSGDGAYSGIAIAGTAGATLAFGDVIYLQASDSRWELADADAASTSGDVMLGMCVLAAAADGDPTRVLLSGTCRADANFPALTIGAQVYVSTTPGDIQVAQPSGTDDVIRVVGRALSADEIHFNPSQDYITHT